MWGREGFLVTLRSFASSVARCLLVDVVGTEVVHFTYIRLLFDYIAYLGSFIPTAYRYLLPQLKIDVHEP
jgi:hypothetical protein